MSVTKILFVYIIVGFVAYILLRFLKILRFVRFGTQSSSLILYLVCELAVIMPLYLLALPWILLDYITPLGRIDRPRVEKLKAEGNLQGLIKTLEYSSSWGAGKFRQRAAEALGEIGDVQAVGPLVAALKNYKDIRQAASQALVKIGPVAVEPFVAAIKDLSTLVLEETATQMENDVLRVKIVNELVVRLGRNLGYLDYSNRWDALKKINPKWIQSEAAEPFIEAIKGVPDWALGETYERVENGVLREKIVIELILRLGRDPIRYNNKWVETQLEKTDPNWIKSEMVKSALPAVLAGISSIQEFSQVKYTLEKIDPKWKNLEAAKVLLPLLRKGIIENDDIEWYERGGIIKIIEQIGGTQAIKVLIDAAATSGHWRFDAKDALERILMHNAERIELAELHTLSHLKISIYIEGTGYGDYSSPGRTSVASEEINHLALQEINRRRQNA